MDIPLKTAFTLQENVLTTSPLARSVGYPNTLTGHSSRISKVPIEKIAGFVPTGLTYIYLTRLTIQELRALGVTL